MVEFSIITLSKIIFYQLIRVNVGLVKTDSKNMHLRQCIWYFAWFHRILNLLVSNKNMHIRMHTNKKLFPHLSPLSISFLTHLGRMHHEKRKDKFA
jgi:hypothetical protein